MFHIRSLGEREAWRDRDGLVRAAPAMPIRLEEPHMNAVNEIIDSIRLKAVELEAVLQESNLHEIPVEVMEHGRSEPRYPLRGDQRMEAWVRHPAGNEVSLLVAARNLSANGAGILHGHFLHAGTRIVLRLRAESGDLLSVEGKAVRCRHINRHIHDVGIRFRRAIDPGMFVEIDGQSPVLEVTVGGPHTTGDEAFNPDI